MQQGFFKEKQDIPQMEYISWSKCREILKSPRGFYNKYGLGKVTPPTDAMIFGSLFHAMLLEPEKLKSKFLMMPDFGPMQSSTNRAKRDAWKAEYQWATFVNADDIEKAKEMIERVREHPRAGYLQDGHPEQFGYAKRPNDKWLMAIADYKLENMIVEVKTTSKGIDWDSFFREMLNHNYHAQLALSINVANIATDVRHGGVFVVCSTVEPYDVAVYEIPDNILIEGEAIAADAIGRIDYFLDLDPGMTNKTVWQSTEPVGVTPPWFFKRTMG